MTPSDPLPATPHLTPADLGRALRAGLADFAAAPIYGLFFGGILTGAGLVLSSLGAGLFTWTLTLTLGFPLVAPFLAVGLYEVSRRREAGAPLSPGAILGVLWAERGRQMPWLGMFLLIAFLFWSFFAHILFALVLGPSALTGPVSDWASYADGRIWTLLAAEIAFGAACAALVFALTVMAIPILLDRELDLVTAMRLSYRTVRANPGTLLLWAMIVAGLTLAALAPWFLGLPLVLPVLAHASWHLYRRAFD
ncbi:DUF2189 domain-containing protein [Jannaschia sp. KMU-145]|uniref:DUF2189 domain-containing protein n=1 Tax=Jannaschia halovivens TaxID=3388667 RepID=UPI00396AFA8A